MMALLLAIVASGMVSAQDAVEVESEFTVIGQGQIGEVRVTGPDIIRVRAAFLDAQYLFAETEQGDFRGLIAPPIDAPTGRYRLSVLVTFADGEQAYLAQELRVTSGAFDSRDLLLSDTLTELLDPDILLDEFAILDPEITALSGDASWQETGIAPPFFTGISAGFGTFRRFNGSVWQRHTGVDYPAPIGTPVTVAAAGRVVFSDVLEIRGEYVLVDHGAGLFSGYAHLSERMVEIGDVLQQGDTIGLVGNTGRSLGPHLHWEVSLGGVWVDPLEMARRLPPP
jgi:murein DD-endopeptidase MepM/ murein hydrolase activator NlpD